MNYRLTDVFNFCFDNLHHEVPAKYLNRIFNICKATYLGGFCVFIMSVISDLIKQYTSALMR